MRNHEFMLKPVTLIREPVNSVLTVISKMTEKIIVIMFVIRSINKINKKKKVINKNATNVISSEGQCIIPLKKLHG